MTDEKEPEKSEEKPKEPEAKSEPEPAKKEPVAPEERDEQEDSNVATPKSHMGAGWVQPLVKFDAWWTKWEARLAAGVLGAEIFSLVAWIGLKGMSAEYQPNQADPEAPVDVSGIIFRAVVGALVLGTAAHFALRDKDVAKRKTDLRYQLGVSAAVILGMVASRFWANVGVSYFSNVLNWLQNASMLTLFGGLARSRDAPHAVARAPRRVARDGAGQAHQRRRRDALPHAASARARRRPRLDRGRRGVLSRRVGLLRSHRGRRTSSSGGHADDARRGEPRLEGRARRSRRRHVPLRGRQLSLDFALAPEGARRARRTSD